MEPPVLDYAAPATPPPPSRWNTMTATKLCVFATVPVLMIFIAQADPPLDRIPASIERLVLFPLFAGLLISLGFWPALMLLNYASFDRRRPAMVAMLTPCSARYLMLMLLAFLCLSPWFNESPTRLVSRIYGLAHVSVLFWLIVKCVRARLIGVGLVTFVIIAIPLSIRHFDCPHGERWSFFQLPLYIKGDPCNSVTRSSPYWWSDG